MSVDFLCISDISTITTPSIRDNNGFVGIFYFCRYRNLGSRSGLFDMLSVGAVPIFGNATFHAFIEPHGGMIDDEAMAATGLSYEDLKVKVRPRQRLSRPLPIGSKRIPPHATPVFVGFNAAFDWSFINYYFIKYAGKNPFGFTALDIKSFYMGKFSTSWKDTRSSRIDAVLNIGRKPDHNALHDAIYQAELFRRIVNTQQ